MPLESGQPSWTSVPSFYRYYEREKSRGEEEG